MCPLQDLIVHMVRDKEMPYRAIIWIRLLLLGSLDSCLNIPLEGGYHLRCGKDGFRTGLPLRLLKLP